MLFPHLSLSLSLFYISLTNRETTYFF